MIDPPIDSENFRGDGAVFALVLAHARRAYWHAHGGSEAFRSAQMFVDGEKCKHWLCALCRNEESGFRRYLCDAVELTPMELKPTKCIACEHPLIDHWQYEFDWAVHRDLIVGSLGLDVAEYVRLVKAGRHARN